MAQPPDTAAIQRLVARARRRIRAQWALEGATTATVLAAATALAAIFAIRTELVAPGTGLALLGGAGTIILLGALLAASRRLDDETVARRIDRASGLSDRLSTALAFQRMLRGGARPDEHAPDTSHELMQAAIRDGVRAAPRADVRAATPFQRPHDLRAALGFLAISALAAGLAIPRPDRTPHLYRATPEHAPPGAEVQLEGDHLLTGITTPLAGTPLRAVVGAPGVPATATGVAHGFAPTEGAVLLGPTDGARPVAVLDWTATRITIQIPPTAPLGDTQLAVVIAGKRIGTVPFSVVDPKDVRFHKKDSVALDPDEKAYVESILAELHNVAQRDQVPELEDFAKKVEELLRKAENGEITKEQLLDALAKAEDALNRDAEPDQAQVDKQLADLGKELGKDSLTRELGKALQQQDLTKAQQELEKLADKLDQKQLSDKQKEQLGKTLEKVAQQMQKQTQKDQQQRDAKQQQLEKQIRRLEKQKQDAKNEQQRQELERRLQDKQRQLKQLQKEQQQRDQSSQRRALKRLQKDIEKAAESLQKPQQDPKDQQGQNQQDQQASRNLKDAARETGRVDRDRRKQATQRKMSSQMDDLREAMRRAKQRGNKGPQDPFNRRGKHRDFLSRARGQKGSRQAWRPGQPGQGQGQNGQGKNGQGQNGQNGGSTWGTGHDDNLTGDPTAKSGHDKDQDLQGVSGNKGGSTREVILAAAQKGFASARYQKVFANYQRIVEEVMRTEKLPSSYKYYVKRYFAQIHPQMTSEAAGSGGDAAPAPAAPAP